MNTNRITIPTTLFIDHLVKDGVDVSDFEPFDRLGYRLFVHITPPYVWWWDAQDGIWDRSKLREDFFFRLAEYHIANKSRKRK